MSYRDGVVNCAQCGKEKTATNHWFLVSGEGVENIVFSTWDAREARYKKSLCGQGCTVKHFQQWMDKVRVGVPA